MGLDCVIRPQALALSTKPYKTLQKASFTKSSHTYLNPQFAIAYKYL